MSIIPEQLEHQVQFEVFLENCNRMKQKPIGVQILDRVANYKLKYFDPSFPFFKTIGIFDIDDSVVWPSPYNNMPNQTSEAVILKAISKEFKESLKNATLAPWVFNPNFDLTALLYARPRVYITGRHEFQDIITKEYLKNRNLFDQKLDSIYFIEFTNYTDYVAYKTSIIIHFIKLINNLGLKACVIEDSKSVMDELIWREKLLKESAFSFILIKDGLPILHLESYKNKQGF